MPIRLPNGLTIINATPHELKFQCDEGYVVVAESDCVINAIPVSEMVFDNGTYTLNTVVFEPSTKGRNQINKIRELHPDAVIVGSVIAAQAFPEEVVAPVPFRSERLSKGEDRVVRSDRFTIYQKKGSKNG